MTETNLLRPGLTRLAPTVGVRSFALPVQRYPDHWILSTREVVSARDVADDFVGVAPELRPNWPENVDPTLLRQRFDDFYTQCRATDFTDGLVRVLVAGHGHAGGGEGSIRLKLSNHRGRKGDYEAATVCIPTWVNGLRVVLGPNYVVASFQDSCRTAEDRLPDCYTDGLSIGPSTPEQIGTRHSQDGAARHLAAYACPHGGTAAELLVPGPEGELTLNRCLFSHLVILGLAGYAACPDSNGTGTITWTGLERFVSGAFDEYITYCNSDPSRFVDRQTRDVLRVLDGVEFAPVAPREDFVFAEDCPPPYPVRLRFPAGGVHTVTVTPPGGSDIPVTRALEDRNEVTFSCYTGSHRVEVVRDQGTARYDLVIDGLTYRFHPRDPGLPRYTGRIPYDPRTGIMVGIEIEL